MKKINKKELLSIPNILSYIRIILIPIFAYIYLHATTTTDYYVAAGIVGVSGLTDLLDGWIARKFHMITQFGKFLDPLADKLTQGTLLLCLAKRYPLLWVLFGIFLLKDGFLLIMGIIFIRKDKMLDGAKWFGKVCTVLLYFVMFLLIIAPSLSEVTANVVIAICGVCMFATFVLYIPEFVKLGKET